MKNKPNIAIISPSLNAYSETFIQAHKTLLEGNVRYYYGSINNQYLDGQGAILTGFKKHIGKAMNIIKKKPFNVEKKALLASWKQNNIDVILAEYGTTAALYIDVIKASKIPLIIHFHGYDASVRKTINDFQAEYLTMFAYAKYVIVVSETMRTKILDLGCPEEKIIKNTYGPNDLFANSKPKFSKQQFIAIGRFTNKKAPYYTILAFNEILNDFPEAKLLMAGDGNLRETCENLVRYFGIEKSVEFLGIISPKQFRSYLEESVAFVQHSITASNGDMEGTPLAVLEASLAGLPVIASKHAGIPEVIVDEKTGLLFEEHDVHGMAQQMKRVLENSDFAASLGNSGKEYIRVNFSMNKHIHTLNALIKNTI